MRQPKLTHTKRKLRLSPNKFIYGTVSRYPYIGICNLANSNMDIIGVEYTFPLNQNYMKKTVRLLQKEYKLVWHIDCTIKKGFCQEREKIFLIFKKILRRSALVTPKRHPQGAEVDYLRFAR